MNKILITRKLKEEMVSVLREKYVVDMWESADDVMPRNELLERANGASAIICMLTDTIDQELLDAVGDQLEVVSTMSVGFDHINVDLLKERNIRLGYTPDVLTDSVADLTISLMLATARRTHEAAAAAKSGEWGTWSPYWMTGQDLSGSTVGIVGLGAIGAAVARRLKGFNCTILYTSRSRKESVEQDLGLLYVQQDELLKKSDFVTVHSALTPETSELCNAAFFTKMKSAAVFINTSRGGLVQQNDLYTALKEGTIYAAGLDVTTPEPLPLDSPLLSLENCLVLPHIGSASIKTRQAMTQIAVDNLQFGLDGKPMRYEVELGT